MRAIIAAFSTVACGVSYVASLRRVLDVAAQGQTVAAYGEAYDGHRLVVAWVPDEREVEARDLAREAGGMISTKRPGTPPHLGSDGYGTERPLRYDIPEPMTLRSSATLTR